MFRRAAVLSSAALAACLAFFGASWATASPPSPDLPSSLPASKLAKVSLSEAEQIRFNNLIPADVAAQNGVTPESFTHIRILARTELGPLYVIPGTSGICLALSTAAACSDGSSAEEPVLVALFIANDAGQLVGGGITGSERDAAVMVFKSGARVKARSAPGGFVITSSHNVRADARPWLESD